MIRRLWRRIVRRFLAGAMDHRLYLHMVARTYERRAERAAARGDAAAAEALRDKFVQAQAALPPAPEPQA